MARLPDPQKSKVVLAVDPAKPFMKAVGAVGTDTFANCIIAELYNGRSFPVATSYATEFVQI